MIHQYKLNGYNIVLDVFSGSVHVVDDVAYDIIGMYENADFDEICKEILPKYASENLTEQDIRDVMEQLEELQKQPTQISH